MQKEYKMFMKLSDCGQQRVNPAVYMKQQRQQRILKLSKT